MNGDAHAPGTSGSQPLPPAFPETPQRRLESSADQALHPPFFPGASASTAEPAWTAPVWAEAAPSEGQAEEAARSAVAEPEAAAEAVMAEESLPTPEDFGYLEPTAQETAGEIPPEAYLEAPPAYEEAAAEAAPLPTYEEAAYGESTVPAYEEPTYAEPTGSAPPVYDEPGYAQPTESALPAYEEPTYGEPTESALPAFEEPAFAEPTESALPAYEESAFAAALSPQELATPEAEVADRLETLARELRSRGSDAISAGFAGDSLDAALAGLISGYLAGRGR